MMQTYFENLQGMLADAGELREMAIQKRDVVKARDQKVRGEGCEHSLKGLGEEL